MFCFFQEKPQPPEDLEVTNVQKTYMILSWNQPKHGSLYEIHSYTIERKIDSLGNFTVMQALPYSRRGMVMKDLEPSTEYTVRVSSNNKYGRSDGVYITQRTLPGKNHSFIIIITIIIIIIVIVVAVVIGRRFDI